MTAVHLNGVGVRYGSADALVGVDLKIASGECVALVGSSGAGKSTMLGVIAGLISPTEGAVEVLGHDLAGLGGRRLREHRRRVAMVSQQLDLVLSLMTIHNVNAGYLGQWSSARALASLIHPRGRAEAAAALTQVGLEDRIFSRTDNLSGGERQRVAVARVLRQGPDLVLADEPTSSVDPRLSDEVMGLLCRPPTDKPWTSIVSVHDPDLARKHAGRIIGLRHGRVALDTSSGDVSDEDLAKLYQDGS